MRIILTFALIAGITSVVTTPAYSIDPTPFYFSCNGGGTYTVEYAGEPTETPTSGGTVTDGSSCAGAVVIDDSVETIGGNAFSSAAITSITLPANLRSIAANAFESMGLTSITLPASLRIIGDRAFASSGLTSITLPASLVSIGLDAFYGSSIETFTTYSSVNIPVEFLASSATLHSINILGDVETISARAFHDAPNLTSITLPASLRSIDDSAFYGTTNLTSITLPEGLVTIGDYAFEYSGLTSITLPASLVSLGTGVFDSSPIETFTTYSSMEIPVALFQSSTALRSVNILGNVETISASAFASANNLTSITLPASLKSIGDYAFEYSGLTSITLPAGLRSIGDYAFYFSGLTSISLPASMVSLGAGVFGGTNIETFTTYSSMEIRANLFQGSLSLRSVNILGNVETISASAFSGTTNLTSIPLPASLRSIGYGAFDSSGLTSITLPEGLTSIGESAFGASGLASIMLPVSLRSIGNYAFMDTGLTSINIPRGLMDFGERNFDSIKAQITIINYYGGNETITAALQLNLTDTNTVNTDPAKEYRSAGSASQIISLLSRNDANLTLTNYPELDLTGKEDVGTSIYLIHLELNMDQLQSAVSISIAAAKIGSDARYESSHGDDGAAARAAAAAVAAALVAAAAARLAALNAAASALATKAAQNATKDLEAFVVPIATPGESAKPAPTIDTYLSAGVKGVTVGNLDLVNILVKELASTQVTTKALVEIVKIATIVITFSIITNSTQTIIKKSELGSIGISTIAGKDLRAFTAYIATLPVGDRNTPVELVAAAEAFKVKLAADIQRVKDARIIARAANRAAIIAIFKVKR
jgi:BspA type Leucine rich repeat region (6 copies)